MSDKDLGSNRQGDLPTKLVARLEAASEGSSELDAAIAIVADRAERVIGHWRYNEQGRAREVESFTSSLEAALALAYRALPEGWTVEIKTGARPFHRAIIHPRYSMENKQDRCPMGLSKASAAMALCIAILKATTANSVGTDERSEEVNQNNQVIP